MFDYKTAWKNQANHTALETAQYCVLKATLAKSNQKLEIAQALLRRAFTPITNKTKIFNGRTPFDTLNNVIRTVAATNWSKSFCGNDLKEALGEEDWATYKELAGQLVTKDIAKSEPEYMFIFVRQDISPEYQAVQGMHVAYKAGHHFKSNPDETYFVLVGVPNEESLEEIKEKLDANAVGSVEFKEPDIGNVVTAVASEPIKAHRKRFLKNYDKLVF